MACCCVFVHAFYSFPFLLLLSLAYCMREWCSSIHRRIFSLVFLSLFFLISPSFLFLPSLCCLSGSSRRARAIEVLLKVIKLRSEVGASKQGVETTISFVETLGSKDNILYEDTLFIITCSLLNSHLKHYVTSSLITSSTSIVPLPL